MTERSAEFGATQLAEHGPALYRFALSITRDPHLAADLVQDTYLRAIEKQDQFRGEASLLAWLRRILHNLAVDRARRSTHEIVVEDVEKDWRDDAYTVDPAQVAERAQAREELEDSLVHLPFIYRTAVILHDAEAWTVREIAELQDITLPAAKQRLRRGRMMLVTALADGAERRAILKGVPMRCWDARQHISDYLDGVLEHDTANMVEAHLATCPTCPPLYAALVDTHSHVEALRDPNTVIPPELERQIRALIYEADSDPSPTAEST